MDFQADIFPKERGIIWKPFKNRLSSQIPLGREKIQSSEYSAYSCG
jgi:hypothetical protein